MVPPWDYSAAVLLLWVLWCSDGGGFMGHVLIKCVFMAILLWFHGSSVVLRGASVSLQLCFGSGVCASMKLVLAWLVLLWVLMVLS